MGLFYALVLSFILWVVVRNHSFFRLDGIRNEAMRKAFLLKLIAAFCFYAIYTYYYTDRSTSDIYKYFDDATVMYNALFVNPLDYFKMLFGIMNDTEYFTQNYYLEMSHWFRYFDSNIFSDSHVIIRFNAFLMLFSFGHIQIHVVVMAFLSFIGSVALYKAFAKYSPKKKVSLFVAVFLVPSAVFWTSGLMKEGLVCFALGMILYQTDRLFEKVSISSLFWLLFSLFIMIYTKIYVVLIVIPLILSHSLHSNFRKKNIKWLYAGVVATFVVFGIIILDRLAGLNIFEMLAQKQNDYILLAQMENAGSFVNISPLEASFLSFIKAIPNAIYLGFISPIPFLDNSIIFIPNILENILVLILLVLIFIFPCKTNKAESSLINFSFWFFIGVAFLTGLTVPIIGAIVRYKSIALPMLFAIFALKLDHKKLGRKLPFVGKIFDIISKQIRYKSTL